MRKRITFLGLTFFILSTIISCSKNEQANDPAFCNTAWAVAIEDEANELSLAAQAYAADPNSENCAAYKVALQAYVDALKPYGDCATLTGQQRADWEASIAEAEAGIDNMEC